MIWIRRRKTEYFKKLNIDCFYIGVESGSERILKIVRKGINKRQILSAAANLVRADITPWYSFMFGFPFETPMDILQTFDIALRLKEINPDATFELSYFTPYPGTELSKDLQRDSKLNWPTNLKSFENFQVSNRTFQPFYIKFYRLLWRIYFEGRGFLRIPNRQLKKLIPLDFICKTMVRRI